MGWDDGLVVLAGDHFKDDTEGGAGAQQAVHPLCIANHVGVLTHSDDEAVDRGDDDRDVERRSLLSIAL